MSVRLNKDMLVDMGLDVRYPYVYKTNPHTGNPRRLCKHVCTAGSDEIKYIFYSIWHNGHLKTITEARVMYAWYKGEIPENMDIVHIDGDRFNNYPENLKMAPRKGRKMQL